MSFVMLMKVSRVLLKTVFFNRKAAMIFEGMAIGSFAIGAKEGILYLRREYKYLQAYLEDTLNKMREKSFGQKYIRKGI